MTSIKGLWLAGVGLSLALSPAVTGLLQVVQVFRQKSSAVYALSEMYMENDLVAVKLPGADTSRLCAVKQYGTVDPLCRHEDNVETDLFVDPRNPSMFYQDLTDDDIISSYGEGFYGQRPVPSLGGGPGYGAPADEIWSVDEDILEQIIADGVDLPVLDVGIAHGEKARGGAY
jgi:hypothetical protein